MPTRGTKRKIRGMERSHPPDLWRPKNGVCSALETGVWLAVIQQIPDAVHRVLGIEAAANTNTPTVDVAHFRHLTGEWQISGIGAQLQELYRQPFGVAFHGSANALVHSKRYSLEPLRDGPSCLKCDINSRIQVADLVSLKVELPSGNHVTIGGGDVFRGILEMNPT